MLGVDAYYRQVKNLQDEGQFGNALVYSAFNYDEGRIRGLEFSSSYREGDLSAYANLAFSKAEGRNIVSGQFNFDEDELVYVADHWVHLDHDQAVTGSAGINYRWHDTAYGADLLYGSGLRRGFVNSEHLPAYTQVNFSASRTFDLDRLGAIDTRIALLNAFDRIYQMRDGSGIGVGAPQFGPRREIYFGISKPF
jgi:outer membrane receptor protein involved in Fe transport